MSIRKIIGIIIAILLMLALGITTIITSTTSSTNTLNTPSHTSTSVLNTATPQTPATTTASSTPTSLVPHVNESIDPEALNKNIENANKNRQPCEPPAIPPLESNIDCAKEKCVALTFDDGPSAAYTPGLLDTLKAWGVKATFFVTGKQTQKNPHIVQRAASEGHIIGNHTYNHPQLTRLSAEKQEEEIKATDNEITAAKAPTTTFMRPPYGSANKTTYNILESANKTAILWDIDTLDWKHRDATKVRTIINENLHPGAIILMHDIHEASPKAMNCIIYDIQKADYKIVSLSTLLSNNTYAGRPIYSRATVLANPKQ
ncbi:MAG: polysaccharide deacetylase family protein [Actinomycetaceae bacterium]|nr:polysaccharide deacetylase family protein [Actinomycetaceae bacterium]